MTLVLIGKDLVLQGPRLKIEDISRFQVIGISWYLMIRRHPSSKKYCKDGYAFMRPEMKDRARCLVSWQRWHWGKLSQFSWSGRKNHSFFTWRKKEKMDQHLKSPHPCNGNIAACSGSPLLFNKATVSLWLHHILSLYQKTFKLLWAWRRTKKVSLLQITSGNPPIWARSRAF